MIIRLGLKMSLLVTDQSTELAQLLRVRSAHLEILRPHFSTMISIFDRSSLVNSRLLSCVLNCEAPDAVKNSKAPFFKRALISLEVLMVLVNCEERSLYITASSPISLMDTAITLPDFKYRLSFCAWLITQNTKNRPVNIERGIFIGF